MLPMNIIFKLRYIPMIFGMLCLCLFVASCGAQKQHNFKANRGGEGEFSFSHKNPEQECEYILNLSSARIHRINCRHVSTIKDEHRLPVSDLERALEEEYSYCATCFPAQHQSKLTENKEQS